MTQTANVMVTESVSQQELSGVEDQRVELDSLNQSGNAHSAAGSDSGSSETWIVRIRLAKSYPSTDPIQSDGGNQKTW